MTTRMTRKWMTFTCATIVVLLEVVLIHAQTAQDVAKMAFKSTVLLVMKDANGQPLSLGSGFFIRNDEIVSNLHVIEGASSGYAKLIDQKIKYDLVGITAVDPNRDLVILKIETRSKALPLGNSEAVQVGEIIYAVGNPQGLEGTFSQGIVSSIRKIGRDQLLQITAPISPGSSGGPVLNGKGEVVGVAVATFRGGQNLNFAIPSIYLKALLNRSGKPKPFAKALQAKTARSILSDLGERNIEGVIGGTFTWKSQLYEMDGEYTITLRNMLRVPVKNVYCLVIFYDKAENPLDVDVIRYWRVIPAGLAKRVSGYVDSSVKRLTTPPSRENPYLSSFTPATKVEFRILDFELVN